VILYAEQATLTLSLAIITGS